MRPFGMLHAPWIGAVFAISMVTEALALPIPWHDTVTDPKEPGKTIRRTIPGTARWPAGSTVNVYVRQDPGKGGTRHERVKEGIQRWADQMTARGLTLNVRVGDPPAGTKNLVEVVWEAPNSLPRDSKGNAQDAIAEPNADVIVDPGGAERIGNLTDARIRIESDTTGDEYLRNLGMHEFGHALGLADEATGEGKPHNAMDHKVLGRNPQALTERDLAEVSSVYGNAQGKQPRASVKGQVSQQAGGFRYEYRVRWEDGPDIPMFQVDPSFVYDIVMPSNWRLFDPESASGREGFTEDVYPVVTGMQFAERTMLTFFTFENPLNSQNPEGYFAFSSAAPPTIVPSYAMGEDLVYVPGPSRKIPEPAMLGLVAVAAWAARRSAGRGPC